MIFMTQIKKIIQDFAFNEAKIEKLYHHYGRLFPDYRELWFGLAKEEKRHAEMLNNLSKIKTLKDSDLEISAHALAVIAYVSGYIDKKLGELNSKLVIKKALENSLSLEQSMVEEKCFELFRPHHEEISAVFNQLNLETKGHAKIIALTLEKI